MALDQILFLLILAGGLYLFVSERVRIDVSAMLILLALVVTGVLDSDQALSGFASEPAIIVAAVFVISGALAATGITEHIGQWIGRAAGKSEARAIAVTMPAVAAMASFTHHVMVTAMMLPILLRYARERKLAASRLLMPMSLAASLGTTLTLVSAPAFLLADDMIERTGSEGPTPAYENIDRAYLRGGELEASYRSGPWNIGAAISVVNGRNQDGEDLNTLPNNRLVLSASWQATSSWKFGMRSTLAASRDKPVSATNPAGEDRAGFGTHDIYAIWTPDQGALQGVEVNFGIDNVTNKNYTPATYLLGPAAGRNFKISLSRTF